MEPKTSHLRARIERTADGLFRSAYGAGDPSENLPLPDSHVGLSEAEVREWVEQMASWSGYAGVTWEQTPAAGPSQLSF